MHNHSNGNELCIFMQRTRYHLNGFAPRLAEGISNSEMACYFILTKGGFVPLSQFTQKFAVTDELATVCETILSCRLFLRHVGLTLVMPCKLTSPWVDENDQNQILWPAVFVKTWGFAGSAGTVSVLGFRWRWFCRGQKNHFAASKVCFM